MPMGTNGIITEHRGAEPAQWHHSTMTPAITFTWHHTIPWNCLRAVWNGLVHGQHWDAVKEFLELVSAANVPTIVQGLKAGNLTVDRDTLHTQLTWQGWNIVEGPGNEYRQAGDDPGEEFDNWSGEGMSGNQKTTLLTVKDLYTNCMKTVAQRPVVPATTIVGIDKPAAKQVETAMRKAKGTLRGKAPVSWTEAMWAVVTEGRVDQKSSALWYTKPVWRRR